jgi:hypothetical protein
MGMKIKQLLFSIREIVACSELFVEKDDDDDVCA